MIKKVVIILGVLVLVIAVIILRDRFSRKITYVGTIEATRIDLPARISTTVERILVAEGDTVQAQDLLVELDCRELKIKESAIDSEFQRADRLFRSGSMTKEVYEKIETNRQETKLRASWCNIVAPVSGTVTTHYLDSSEWVNPGAKVIALIDMNDVWTNIYVDQSVFSKLKLGMSVTGKIASDIALPVQGKIIKLNHEAEFTPKNAQTLEERSRLVHGVKIKLEQRDLALKPGMPIEIDLSILREAE